MEQTPEPPPVIIQTAESLTAAAEASETGVLTLAHGDASIALSLHGANLVSYVPSQEVGEVIWTGGYATLPGKDCWGGVPIVWPWFMMGNGETPKGPFHGPARFATWEILDLTQTAEATELLFGLPSPQETRAGEVIPLEAELRIRLGDTLTLQLITRNPSETSQPLEHCFHAYFKVGDVTRIRIDGLQGTEVQDNRKPGGERGTQLIPVTLDGPAARIYRPFPDQVILEDPVLARRLALRSPEAAQLVLWNSGPVREENGNSTGEAEWRTQLALEPLRGLEEAITLEPGEAARLTLEIEATALASPGTPVTE